jgi:hypothetical protein
MGSIADPENTYDYIVCGYVASISPVLTAL